METYALMELEDVALVDFDFTCMPGDTTVLVDDSGLCLLCTPHMCVMSIDRY